MHQRRICHDTRLTYFTAVLPDIWKFKTVWPFSAENRMEHLYKQQSLET